MNIGDETPNLKYTPGEYSVDITDSEGCTGGFSVIMGNLIMI